MSPAMASKIMTTKNMKVTGAAMKPCIGPRSSGTLSRPMAKPKAKTNSSAEPRLIGQIPVVPGEPLAEPTKELPLCPTVYHLIFPTQ